LDKVCDQPSCASGIVRLTPETLSIRMSALPLRARDLSD
jgi:hypothetical protein